MIRGTDVSPPIFHECKELSDVAKAQVGMAEWQEAQQGNSDYEIILENLYSVQWPYQFAVEYPILVVPQELRRKVIEEAHEKLGHMAAMKTLLKL